MNLFHKDRDGMHLKKMFPITTLVVFLSIIFTSFGYAALNTSLNLSGEAYVRVESDIRITDIRLVNAVNASEVFQSKYSKDTITMGVNLKDTSSKVVYEYTVKNDNNKDYLIVDIAELSNVSSNVVYSNTAKEKVIIPAHSSKTFQLTFTATRAAQSSLALQFKFSPDEVTPPVITGGSNSWSANNLTISIATSGTATGGVKNYEYYVSDVLESPGNKVTGTTANNVTVSEEGTHYVFYRTVSNTGKKSSWSGYRITNIDKQKPTIKSVNYTDLSQDGYSVNVVATDTLSGVGKYSYVVTGGNSATNSTSSTFKANKVAKITITVYDAAGNSATGSYQMNAIDQYIAQLYRGFLSREASASDISTWRNSYNSSKNMLAIVKGVALSSEATTKLSTNTAFVNGCYEGMLGRVGDPTGVAHYVDYLNNGKTKDYVITTMSTAGPEYANIKSLYGFS